MPYISYPSLYAGVWLKALMVIAQGQMQMRLANL